MFLIAGIAPKTKILDPASRTCPACGLAQARLCRIDHYLNLFFIPILRVKTGRPVLVCSRCGHAGDSNASVPEDAANVTQTRCRDCGRVLEKEFRFCPYCGKPV